MSLEDLWKEPLSKTKTLRVSGKAKENSSKKIWKQIELRKGNSKKKLSPVLGSTAP